MKDLFYSQVALIKYGTNAAFQKFYSAKHSPDLTIMSLGSHIVTTCEGTDITNYNKRMFFGLDRV
jgi:hypothetical protein